MQINDTTGFLISLTLDRVKQILTLSPPLLPGPWQNGNQLNNVKKPLKTLPEADYGCTGRSSSKTLNDSNR